MIVKRKDLLNEHSAGLTKEEEKEQKMNMLPIAWSIGEMPWRLQGWR